MNKNYITLYHYSNDNLKVINPLFFGNNNFTLNDKKACNVKRSFFYIDDKFSEIYFKNVKYLYIVKVNKNKIYNLKSDNKNLKQKFKNDIKGLLSYCKKHYKGILYKVSFDIVCLFKNIKVLNKIEYKKGF